MKIRDKNIVKYANSVCYLKMTTSTKTVFYFENYKNLRLD